MSFLKEDEFKICCLVKTIDRYNLYTGQLLPELYGIIIANIDNMYDMRKVLIEDGRVIELFTKHLEVIDDWKDH